MIIIISKNVLCLLINYVIITYYLFLSEVVDRIYIQQYYLYMQYLKWFVLVLTCTHHICIGFKIKQRPKVVERSSNSTIVLCYVRVII